MAEQRVAAAEFNGEDAAMGIGYDETAQHISPAVPDVYVPPADPFADQVRLHPSRNTSR
jgi:hypothetical protein